VGKPWFGLIGIEPRYVTFKPGEVPASVMARLSSIILPPPSGIRTKSTA
jgi:hypothetical protein